MKTIFINTIIGCVLLSMPALAARPDAKRDAKHEVKPEVKHEVKEYSGFLVDYSQLKPGPEGGVAKVYKKEDADFKKYKKIMLDHVVFYLKEESAHKGIDPVELAELSQQFHKAAVEELDIAYPLVGKPGPDVMRVRVAITDLELPEKSKDAVNTVLPAGFVVSTVKSGAAGKDAGVGEISMEFEILDSVTSQRIAAGVDRRAIGTIESATKFATAEDAFKFWVTRLRTRLDEVHGK
jgi:hypothetical protein